MVFRGERRGKQSSPSEYKGSSIRNRLSINCVGEIMSGIIRILESLGGGGGGGWVNNILSQPESSSSPGSK